MLGFHCFPTLDRAAVHGDWRSNKSRKNPISPLEINGLLSPLREPPIAEAITLDMCGMDVDESLICFNPTADLCDVPIKVYFHEPLLQPNPDLKSLKV